MVRVLTDVLRILSAAIAITSKNTYIAMFTTKFLVKSWIVYKMKAEFGIPRPTLMEKALKNDVLSILLVY